MLWLLRLVPGAALFALSVLAPAQTFDFDRDEVGSTPAGWFLPVPGTEFTVQADGDGPGRCARLHRGAGAAPVRNAMRTFEVAAHRGEQVTLRARVRVGKGGRAQVWLRVDRPGEQMGFFDNMQDRPITTTDWQDVEITGLVATDAERIALGVLLLAGDDAWIDDLRLEYAAAAAGAAPQPAAPLSPRGLDNVAAFARLVGYVRHFHPSDAAAAVDWERFACDGMRDVEQSADAAALAADLQRRFAAVAPTMRVVPTEGAPEEPRLEVPNGGARGLQCVAWVHDGVGLGEPSIYKSKRVFRSMSRRGELPDPSRPLRIDLDGGVTCLLPVALFARGGSTLPPSAAPDLPPRPRYGGEDRATRLAGVALAWNVFEHFYPYFDVVGGDWHATLRTALAAAATDPDERAYLHTMQRLVADLHDGHGNVSWLLDTHQASLPVAVGWIEEQLVVTAVSAGAAGRVAVGDVITDIDGAPAADVFAATMALQSGATDGWRRYRAEHALTLGEAEREVRLGLRRGDAPRQEVALRRAFGAAATPPRPEPIAELEPGIWYLDVDRATDATFTAALPQFEKAKAIVVDFRGYPRGMSPQTLFGHFLTETARSARWCVPHVLLPDRRGMQCPEVGRWTLRPQRPHLDARLVFVTHAGAISYAESCLGIVEHYHLGEIVGERSAGTNGNVNPFSVPGKLTISWTGMRVLKHDGSQHHGVGIAPTVPVSRTVVGVRAGRDELLQKAVEVARGDK
ncbi:MAG: hypothetical protein H6838_15255 [Planctomycetes bacterium]|nr:hypothetical protein [Planctomycetota bacterium]MCB9886849.1 hypothetical protein [Planctomycetota bacterium]